MKLAKKMLVSVLALAMVAALALTAFAANPALVTPDELSAKVGEEVTFTVKGSDVEGLKSGDLVFEFDDTALQYVSCKRGYSDFDLFTAGLQAEDAKKLSCSFAYMEQNADGADDDFFCTVVFKALKAGATDINLVVSSWETDDGSKAAGKTIKVNVTADEPTTATPGPEPTTKAPVEDPSKQPVNPGKIDQTGETGIAIVAGVMAVAAVAFVATRKKEEQ